MPHIGNLLRIIDTTDTTDLPKIPSNFSDWKNILFFEELFQLKDLDFSTEAVGSLFIKLLKNIDTNCRDRLIPMVNDLFTLPKQDITLPDIALTYTSMDFKILETQNHFKDSQQLNRSLKACIEDVHFSIFDNEGTSEMYIDTPLENSAKYMEPSPCKNLTKFPSCNHYCTWHKNFFENIPRDEFLTIMNYALPQRKIR